MKNVPGQNKKDVSINVVEEARKMKKEKDEYDELFENMQRVRSNREFLTKRNNKTEMKIKEKDDNETASQISKSISQVNLPTIPEIGSASKAL